MLLGLVPSATQLGGQAGERSGSFKNACLTPFY